MPPVAHLSRLCKVCGLVDPFDLIELDTLMGDPSAWPATVWGEWKMPSGDLPASYRRFGSVEMGLAWLLERGLPVTRRDVRRHYRFDVPKIAVTTADLIANGLVAKGNIGTPIAKINPLRFLDYYDKGIEVGVKGLEILQQRIADLQEKDIEVPLALVKMALDAGQRLAMSQAAIRASGKTLGAESDVDEGFRAGSAPAASPRFGGVRVRTVEGVTRPVADEGPADRAHYSERAAQEGGAGLPHR